MVDKGLRRGRMEALLFYSRRVEQGKAGSGPEGDVDGLLSFRREEGGLFFGQNR